MPAQPDDRPTYVLAVAMAGAVSAGAYTAGVFDVLIRALDAHARAGKGPRIVLKALSGTSAGGVTACLGVAALAAGRPEAPVEKEYHASDAGRARPQSYRVGLDRLHAIWVDELDLTGPGGLLGAADLAPGGPLLSALDSTAIDRAADRALDGATWGGAPYPFVADPFDLFVTTTGLEGVVYEARFGGDDRNAGHLMARHGRARHFAVRGLGSAPLGSDWLALWRDAGVAVDLPAGGGPLDFSTRETLAARDPPAAPTALTEFRETGVATGAFPFGLAARIVRSRMGEHAALGTGQAEGGAMPYDVDPDDTARPIWGAAEPRAAGDATHVAVDGGVCNNEPFELARFAIRETARDPAAPWRLAPNPRDPFAADRAVLMIDPFPEGPAFTVAWPDDPEGDPRALSGLVGRLFGALVAQARFKPTELQAAMDADVRSRFLIAPSRRPEGAPEGARVRGAAAIASGALGGFSGFFDRRFRQHDFILGQRNARSFLAQHFTLPLGNPAMGGETDPARRAEERPVLGPDNPVLNEPNDPPVWPTMSREALQAALDAIGRRLDAVVAHQLAAERPVWPVRLLIRAGFAIWGRDIALRAIGRRLEASLLDHGLIEAALPALAREGLGRRVLGALLGPGPDLRTAEGLAWALARADAKAAARPCPAGADPAATREVEAVLEALSTEATDPAYRTRRYGVRRGRRTWAIARLGPGWSRRTLPFLSLSDDLPPRR
jgi:hypothetical protein